MVNFIDIWISSHEVSDILFRVQYVPKLLIPGNKLYHTLYILSIAEDQQGRLRASPFNQTPSLTCFISTKFDWNLKHQYIEKYMDV